MFRLALLALLLGCHGTVACPSHQAASVPLTLWEEKLLLPASINGTPQTMALDTGAGVSMISRTVAGAIDLRRDFDHALHLGGVGGRESIVDIGEVDTLQIDRLRIAHLPMPIADLSLRTEAGAAVAGLLGADVLRRFDVDIDVPGLRLTLWQAQACADPRPDWAGGLDPVPFELDEGGHILVPVQVGQATVTGVLDTGSAGLAVSVRAAYRAGLTDEDLERDPAIHGTGVNERAWRGHLHRFEAVRFGGATFRGVPAQIVPSSIGMQNDALIGADALIGMPILRQMRLFIDYRARVLFVSH